MSAYNEYLSLQNNEKRAFDPLTLAGGAMVASGVGLGGMVGAPVLAWKGMKAVGRKAKDVVMGVAHDDPRVLASAEKAQQSYDRKKKVVDTVNAGLEKIPGVSRRLADPKQVQPKFQAREGLIDKAKGLKENLKSRFSRPQVEAQAPHAAEAPTPQAEAPRVKVQKPRVGQVGGNAFINTNKFTEKGNNDAAKQRVARMKKAELDAIFSLAIEAYNSARWS